MIDAKAIVEILKGARTYVPVLSRIRDWRREGSASAAHCYTVWLQHLAAAHENRVNTQPETVAELGPGSSLGLGMCALLCGARRYWALDVVRSADSRANLKVLDQLVGLLESRASAPPPGLRRRKGRPAQVQPFPHDVLTDARLRSALAPPRVAAIRAVLRCLGTHQGIEIAYHVPWHEPRVIRESSVDMILSSAVMEHVADLDHTYRAMWTWLRGGGFMSHTIDFSCHNKASSWNGHWTYSDRVWRLISGNRPYTINREPHSVHVKAIEGLGFQIVLDRTREDTSGVGRKALAPRYKNIPPRDLVTRGALIQAVKPQP